MKKKAGPRSWKNQDRQAGLLARGQIHRKFAGVFLYFKVLCAILKQTCYTIG